jgi:hypothetical protein
MFGRQYLSRHGTLSSAPNALLTLCAGLLKKHSCQTILVSLLAQFYEKLKQRAKRVRENVHTKMQTEAFGWKRQQVTLSST